jgi:hypothetical protein
MEAMCSSEKSVDSQRTTRRYIPEDVTPQVELQFGFFYMPIVQEKRLQPVVLGSCLRNQRIYSEHLLLELEWNSFEGRRVIRQKTGGP